MKKKPTFLKGRLLIKTLLKYGRAGLLLTALVASDSFGAADFLWAKQGKYTLNGFGVALAADADGNTYSIGNFSGTVDFDPGAGIANMTANGKADAFILKLNKDGGFLWAKQIGGSDDDNAACISLDASGNIYLCGVFKSSTIDINPGTAVVTLTRSGVQDAYTLKLDASGNYVWGKQIGGGSSEVDAYSIVTDGTGNVIFGGYFSETADFDPGTGTSNMTCKSTYYEGFICKLTSSGVFAWSRQFEGDEFNGVSNIAADATGNIYATGIYQQFMDCDPGTAVKKITTKGAVDLFIAKLDGSGNFVWSNHAGGTEPDWARGIAVDGSGNVFVAGTFDGNADFDPEGTGYYVTSTGSWNPDAFVMKLNSSGKFSWLKQWGSITPDDVGGMVLDTKGNIYICGSFGGVLDFDPGAGTNYLTAKGGIDAYTLKLDLTGSFVWAKNTPGNTPSTSQSDGYNVAVDADQNVYTSGNFINSVDFDPGAGIFNMNSSDGNHFISKIGTKSAPSSFPEEKLSSPVTVTPNPFTGKCQIICGKIPDNGLITVRNLLGQVVKEYSDISTGTLEVDLSGQPAGTYVLELKSSDINAVVKIIKQ